ncbi:Maf family protein [Wenzhouxiangella sp. EGI_FJ10305]|uniref:Maf family protein n=1 Tax=Wenzhouxiangella sp. EGI_FJ10305 TaxID=3243768 RepID=UPI0035D967E3
MNTSSRLILASASPRRRELLSLFEIDFDVQPADIDETVREGEPPEDYVRRMAREKALAIHDRDDEGFVIGSDTAVVLDGECLGKPVDDDDARDMLERLSGTVHQVLSAVALVAPGGRVVERLSVTAVEFARPPGSWIDRYVASGEPHDKAGAYGIQGTAGIWVRSLSGSYTGVVGLPLFETGELLRKARFVD